VMSHLSAKDLAAMSRVNHHFRKLTDDESIWIRLAQKDFDVRLHSSEEFSCRLSYQSVLYPYRGALGVWQRQNLKHYGGLLKVSLTDHYVSFDDLIPELKVGEPSAFKRQPFLRISRKRSEESAVIENLSKIAVTSNVKINLPSKDNSTLSVRLVDIKDATMKWSDMLTEFMKLFGGENEQNQLRLKKAYLSRSLYFYKKLPMNWAERKLPLKSGIFIASYGPHGTEVISLNVAETMKGSEGVKVTGDPNVPFGEITFRLTEDECLDVPLDCQENTWLLEQFLMDPQYISYQEGLDLDFQVPRDCFGREDIPFKKCKGRWNCECQIARHGFVNPEFIPGNLVLFSDDLFAIHFIDLHTMNIYRRVTEELE